VREAFVERSSVLNFDPWDLLAIVLRTTAVYIFLLVVLRLAGKRELGQLRLFDLVVVLIISDAVQNAMVGPDTSLTGGLIAATVLVLLNWGVDRFSLRKDRLGLLFTGSPTLLIHDGRIIDGHLQREGVSEDELLMALREHGYASPGGVKLAVLEVDGTISVVSQDVPVQHGRRRVRGRKPAE
jgi:uncharacterized membrane protein YcaP (DUF421 family)